MPRRPDSREAPLDYPDDFNLDEARRQAFDALNGNTGNTFHIHHPAKRDYLTLGLMIFAAVTQIAMWVWWGGRLSQRVDQLETQQDNLYRLMMAAIERDNKQDVTMGIISSQYGEVSRRFENVDKQMERRR